VSGHVNYGVLRFEGLSAPIDYAEAAKEYKAAADSGDSYEELHYDWIPIAKIHSVIKDCKSLKLMS
jgi:hypothetical protein